MQSDTGDIWIAWPCPATFTVVIRCFQGTIRLPICSKRYATTPLLCDGFGVSFSPRLILKPLNWVGILTQWQWRKWIWETTFKGLIMLPIQMKGGYWKAWHRKKYGFLGTQGRIDGRSDIIGRVNLSRINLGLSMVRNIHFSGIRKCGPMSWRVISAHWWNLMLMGYALFIHPSSELGKMNHISHLKNMRNFGSKRNADK